MTYEQNEQNYKYQITRESAGPKTTKEKKIPIPGDKKGEGGIAQKVQSSEIIRQVRSVPSNVQTERASVKNPSVSRSKPIRILGTRNHVRRGYRQ